MASVRCPGILAAVLALIASCSDADPAARKAKDQGQGAVDLTTATVWLTTAADQASIQTIFKVKCASCHPSLGRNRDYVSYDVTKTNIENVMARINDGSMPPGGLDAGLKATVQRWVDAGLRESP